MHTRKTRIAENILTQISIREGKTVEEIKKEIKKAMLIGLCSQDAKVQAYWKSIPCKGEIPRPEEVIAFLADETKKKK